MKIIECDGIKEKLAAQRPEFIQFYETWKRILTKNGWEKMPEFFRDDEPVDQIGNIRNRVCTLGYLQGPAYYECIRVRYNAKEDDLVYVIDVGDSLSVDRHKD